MEISLENLYVDIGAYRVNRLSPKSDQHIFSPNNKGATSSTPATIPSLSKNTGLSLRFQVAGYMQLKSGEFFRKFLHARKGAHNLFLVSSTH